MEAEITPVGGGGPRRWWIVIGLILLVILVAVAAYAMTRRGGSDDGGKGGGHVSATSEEAVRQGLVTLREIAGTPLAGATGLKSPDEAARVQPAPAFAVFAIPLDALRGYQSGSDAQTLLRELPTTVVPLLIDGQVRSSMTISRTEGGFVAGSFGDVARVAPAAAARDRGAGDFLVRVPALGLEFVGRRDDGRLMLTAISADPRLRMQAGQTMPAEAVLDQLAPIARTVKDDAPM